MNSTMHGTTPQGHEWWERAIWDLSTDDVADEIREAERLSPEVQALLAQHPHPRVRTALGQHEHLTPEVQLLLADDGGHQVRWALAENPNLTPEAAEILMGYVELRFSQRTRDDTTSGFLRNPAVPVVLLLEAHRQPLSSWAHAALLSNPAFPLSVLGDLGSLPNDDQEVISLRRGLTLEEAGALRVRHLYQITLDVLLRDRPHGRVALEVARTWDGTLGDLVTHVEKLLEPLSEKEAETYEKLLPDWSGTPQELLEAVTRL